MSYGCHMGVLRASYVHLEINESRINDEYNYWQVTIECYLSVTIIGKRKPRVIVQVKLFLSRDYAKERSLLPVDIQNLLINKLTELLAVDRCVKRDGIQNCNLSFNLVGD